jgi:hypothetical protein
MHESAIVITKRVGDIWSFTGEDEQKGRHKNAEGRECLGRQFKSKGSEIAGGTFATVECLMCRRIIPGSEHGLTE